MVVLTRLSKVFNRTFKAFGFFKNYGNISPNLLKILQQTFFISEVNKAANDKCISYYDKHDNKPWISRIVLKPKADSLCRKVRFLPSYFKYYYCLKQEIQFF